MSPWKSWRRSAWLWAALALAPLWTSARAQSVPEDTSTKTVPLSEVEDELDTIFIEEWEGGKPLRFDVSRVRERFSALPEAKKVSEPKPVAPARVHPEVLRWQLSLPKDAVVNAIVSTRETLKIPRFPQPDFTESRDSELNKRALARSSGIVAGRGAQRSESSRGLRARVARAGGKIGQEFWLVPAVQVAIPVGGIAALLADASITYIEPAQGGELPPANANPNDDVDDARASIQSDPYFNQSLTSGWIGLLDTGVHRTHTLLSSPGRIALWRDCTSGDPSCLNGNPDDSCWNHGTSAAGIISGNGNQGNPQRGVTGIQIDSWKVYPHTVSGSTCTGGLSATATVLAFQQAVLWLDRVIVAEMQGSGNESSAISVAADAAFDAGSAVIAANGNNGPGGGTVNVPAVAHKVIGVGAFDVETGTQFGGQSQGPASDGRFKPDIQTPNLTETASTGCAFGVVCAPLSNTANRVFGGTSGAVPYGGAAAALARNWMLRFGQTDPGHVYARLILAAQDPFPFDNTVGAGRIKLPINGVSWWGKVSVGNGQVVDIPLSIGSGKHDLDGSLWWPEGQSGHNDVDLSLVSPSGSVVASSISINSVFERARAAGNVASGTWKLRIRGFSVSGQQTVYYGATVRN